MSKAKAKKDRDVPWAFQTTMRRVLFCKRRALAVMVTTTDDGQTWLIAALEGPRHADTQTILDTHAHKLIGEAETLTQAMILADAYAAEWLASGRPLEPCACEDIPELTEVSAHE